MSVGAVRIEPSDLISLIESVGTLTLFRDVLADEVGHSFVELVSTLANELADDGQIGQAYRRLFLALAETAELYEDEPVGDAWQNHLLDRILDSENVLARKAERAGGDRLGSALLLAARLDLAALRRLFVLDGSALRGLAVAAGVTPEQLVPWEELAPLSEGHRDSERSRLKRHLSGKPDWVALLPALVEHYGQGVGLFGKFRAFRWVRPANAAHGHLEGVAHPDRIRLDDLVEHGHERDLLLANTRQLVAGYRANNVLLYGDRGTGKSSTVKALLTEFGDQGLRLIEVSKHDLADFGAILGAIRGRRERFVLFIDDLSFDEQETWYKDLKAVLEGGIESRPDNVVLYATSNRRHLVQEWHTDRGIPSHDEIHWQDTAQEKLSISDRFGITLTFRAPDQAQYLRIVAALAQQAGLEIARQDLEERAIRWSLWHKGRTGRTARQFVDHLTGELALERNALR
ncbi:MAG: ATP-binding protein [Chloroflexi bacterium]|nr:ATP-binding protein [Chloroflexota bacterium]